MFFIIYIEYILVHVVLVLFYLPLICLSFLFIPPLGSDWQAARSATSTPLHILDPTGFSIELKKSIVSDDALLPR